MCLDVKKRCSCGEQEVQFHLKDNIMPAEVIDRIYCPECSDLSSSAKEEMVEDNGWVIQYDMDIARMFAISKLEMDPTFVSPEYIFDSGYATWLEMYPGEKADITDERNSIIAKKETDPKAYLKEITAWSIDRVARLKNEGWRKAKQA
jgi:hypothetical protein